jgi:hypothetical protein
VLSRRSGAQPDAISFHSFRVPVSTSSEGEDGDVVELFGGALVSFHPVEDLLADFPWVMGATGGEQEGVKSPFDFCKVLQQVRETPKVKRRLDPFLYQSLQARLQAGKIGAARQNP